MGHEGRDRARTEIERRIVCGELHGGAVLDEPALATELDVERGTVREALACLLDDGFVRAEDDGGFSVGELNEIELREAYPIVIILEGLAVRTAPEHPPAKIARLREVNAAMSARADDAMAAATLDYDFHEALYGDCGNEQLLATLRPLKRMLQRYEYAYMGEGRNVARSVARHEEIADALERGDREAAAWLVEVNFREAMPDLISRVQALAGAG
jgi:DNA-binding GntR family transcriptional regulator